MTPEERNLVTELFDRLATLEDAARDPAAERAITEGLRQAPNAVYSLVQTVLLQDEALKRADARIRALEGTEAPARDTSFLGGAREQVWGQHEATRAGSVPSVKPAVTGGMSPAWRSTGVPAAPAPQAQPTPQAPEPAPGGMGGSFLGTAAAAAAGVVGGSLLMGGLRSMMGGGQAHAAYNPAAPRDASPWGGGSEGGDLARQAGLDDMGKAPRGLPSDDGGRAGLFGSGDDELQDVSGDGGDLDGGDFDDGDFGGDE